MLLGWHCVNGCGASAIMELRTDLVGVKAEIEGSGVLRNPIISWHQGHGNPPPALDQRA